MRKRHAANHPRWTWKHSCRPSGSLRSAFRCSCDNSTPWKAAPSDEKPDMDSEEGRHGTENIQVVHKTVQHICSRPLFWHLVQYYWFIKAYDSMRPPFTQHSTLTTSTSAGLATEKNRKPYWELLRGCHANTYLPTLNVSSPLLIFHFTENHKALKEFYTVVRHKEAAVIGQLRFPTGVVETIAGQKRQDPS